MRTAQDIVDAMNQKHKWTQFQYEEVSKAVTRCQNLMVTGEFCSRQAIAMIAFTVLREV